MISVLLLTLVCLNKLWSLLLSNLLGGNLCKKILWCSYFLFFRFYIIYTYCMVIWSKNCSVCLCIDVLRHIGRCDVGDVSTDVTISVITVAVNGDTSVDIITYVLRTLLVWRGTQSRGEKHRFQFNVQFQWNNFKPEAVQDYHFSGISGNLKMSGNSAKVSQKSGKRVKSQGKVGEFV